MSSGHLKTQREIITFWNKEERVIKGSSGKSALHCCLPAGEPELSVVPQERIIGLYGNDASG